MRLLSVDEARIATSVAKTELQGQAKPEDDAAGPAASAGRAPRAPQEKPRGRFCFCGRKPSAPAAPRPVGPERLAVELPSGATAAPRVRRGGVSSEVMGNSGGGGGGGGGANGSHRRDEPAARRVVYRKSRTAEAKIDECTRGHMLFRPLVSDQRAEVVAAMFRVRARRGEVIINEGEDGAHFFVIESGTVEFLIAGRKVGETSAGAFGDLSLMYHAPRAATVRAVTDATLWAVDRQTFRRILFVSSLENRRLYEDFLHNVPILESLTHAERAAVADVLKTEDFVKGETIVRQGDSGDSFFIIVSGRVSVVKDGKAVNRLHKGDFFGELALIEEKPRAASVIADEPTRTVSLDALAFTRLLGPIEDILHRHRTTYGR